MIYGLKMYFHLISVQIRSQMQYRTSFIMDVFSTALLNGSYFLAIVLTLQRFNNISGWVLGEIAFMAGMAEMSFATMDMLFSGFDHSVFSMQVQLGTFDLILLRPVNITVQVLGSKFILRRLGRILEGLVIFTLSLILANIHWTIGKIMYLPLVFISQVIGFGAIFIGGATLIFWTVKPIEAVNILSYGGNEVMSYPMTIYPKWLRYLYTFIIPFIFLNYYPALFFLEKSDPLNFPSIFKFMAPVFSVLMFLVALSFWKFGIKHYKSTGT